MEKPRMLLVDDDSDLAETIQYECEQLGYRVSVVHDGQAAWDILKKREVIAVMSDVQMPGMSGNELINMARSNGIMTPFVLMSGNHGSDAIFQALRGGACDFIQKPIRPEVLRRVVPRAVDLGVRLVKIDTLLQDIKKSGHPFEKMARDIECLTKEIGQITALGAQGEWEPI